MEEILTQARKLAALLKQDPRFVTLRRIENQVLADTEARSLAERYEQSRLTLQHKEQALEPVSVEEKRQLQELHERLTSREDFRRLSEAQHAYYELMDAVNGTIQGALQAGSTEGEAGPAPEGRGRVIIP
jgi:cell fate (sporulation/competence/biofilm development) regulator YlbF (YheA/YmcA/DUF963 family)